jgi:hypothetical protein
MIPISLFSQTENVKTTTYLAEISLDPVVLDLLLCQSGPELCLQLLLSQDQDDRSRGDALLGFLGDDFVVEVQGELVFSLGNTLGGTEKEEEGDNG